MPVNFRSQTGALEILLASASETDKGHGRIETDVRRFLDDPEPMTISSLNDFPLFSL
jgi:hypothetical protein